MNTEQLFYNSKKALDLANEKLSAEDFDTTLALLSSAYSDVRALLEAVWCRKRSKKLDEQPPGENVQ